MTKHIGYDRGKEKTPKLHQEHEKFCGRFGVCLLNFGWVADANSITSKVTRPSYVKREGYLSGDCVVTTKRIRNGVYQSEFIVYHNDKQHHLDLRCPEKVVAFFKQTKGNKIFLQ